MRSVAFFQVSHISSHAATLVAVFLEICDTCGTPQNKIADHHTSGGELAEW